MDVIVWLWEGVKRGREDSGVGGGTLLPRCKGDIGVSIFFIEKGVCRVGGE